ncbi:MAG: DUF3048 domain-containing protein [Clostridia bacterium]|nr:DUF3048 domain-containing protein [Clostridia bacterium]MDD4375699.1 DUF3048 domain-containing protein [Clostridia bacterium]
MKNKKIIVFIVLLIIVSLSIGAYKYLERRNKTEKLPGEKEIEEKEVEPEPEPEPEVKIFKGMERPIAIMIDNEQGSWPHAGLQDAYMIYEIIIEGGQSRMMALFKGKDTTKIGPVRSSRHYFIKYALEHSAAYVHFGWSPQAERFINSNNVNNINGQVYDGNKFWREGTGYHTAFTNIKNIKEIMKSKNYTNVASSESIYEYSARPYDIEGGKEVEKINMLYSNYHRVAYVYNEEKQVFMRIQRGNPHMDRVTKEQYYAKNIIVMQANNYPIGDGSARQEVTTEGTGNGYYLTHGKAIEITWKKDSAKSKTYFYYPNGKEIVLNDGLTFVQVVPKNQKIDISYKEVLAEPQE